MSEIVHNRIAMLRTERGISRRQLADALGVHYMSTPPLLLAQGITDSGLTAAGALIGGGLALASDANGDAWPSWPCSSSS